MSDTALKNFTAAAAWTATCSVVGSDSASPTGSFLWTKAKFDAVYAQLNGGNDFDGSDQTLHGGVLVSIQGINSVARFGHNGTSNLDGVFVNSSSSLGFSSGANANLAIDTGLSRNAAGILEINNGTPGTLRDLTLRNALFSGGGQIHGDSTNAIKFNVQGANQIVFGANSKIAMYSGEIFGWNSGIPGDGTSDTALARNAAGVVEVNNGTAGTFADLKLRSLYLPGATGLIQSAGSPNGGLALQGGATATDYIECIGPSLFSIAGGNIRMSFNRGDDKSFRNVSSASFKWSASSTDSGTPDTGLSRNAAGVVEVNNGTPGTLATIAVSDAVGLTFVKKLTGVDLKAVADTDIFTVPAGRTFILTALVLDFTSSTAPTVSPTLKIKTGAGDMSPPVSALTAGDMAAGKTVYQGTDYLTIGSSFFAAAAGSQVTLSVGTGATATTLLATVAVIGFYV